MGRAMQLFPWPLALAAALQGCLSPVVPIPPARAVLVSPAAQGGEAIPPEVMEWFIGAQQAYGEGEPAEALRLQRKVMEWLEATPSARPHFRAQSLINLGLWNGALGRHPEALNALSQAEAILRSLAGGSAEARQDLAKALNNQGESLNALARRGEALVAARAAADLLRKELRANPAALLRPLAQSDPNERTWRAP